MGWFSTATNWFNPNLVGEEATGIMTLISPQVLQFIPWLIGLWVMEIVLKTAVFIQSRWQKLTRWLELGLQGFSFYVLYQIYLNGNIFTVAFFNSIAKTGLAIILLIVVLDMIGKLARLLFGRPFSPKNIFKSKLA